MRSFSYRPLRGGGCFPRNLNSCKQQYKPRKSWIYNHVSRSEFEPSFWDILFSIVNIQDIRPILYWLFSASLKVQWLVMVGDTHINTEKYIYPVTWAKNKAEIQSFWRIKHLSTRVCKTTNTHTHNCLDTDLQPAEGELFGLLKYVQTNTGKCVTFFFWLLLIMFGKREL